jgi:dienelactone hydrolase
MTLHWLFAVFRLSMPFAAVVILITTFSVASAADEPRKVNLKSLDGTALTAWLFRPTGGRKIKGVVVALHGCSGLYATRGARRGQIGAGLEAMIALLLAEDNAVLLPDSLRPRGVDELCTKRISGRTVRQAERRRDALGALAWVAAQDWAPKGKIALLGWSNGGSAVLSATDASHPEVASQPQSFVTAIAFYPGCSAALATGYRPNSTLTLLLGEKDDWTPPAPCLALGRRVGATVVVYPDSYHGFDAPHGDVGLRTDVPNVVNPGQGVHVGRNAMAQEAAYKKVREVLDEAFR